MNQKRLDELAEALRRQGLTWAQTSFAISLIRNEAAAEREQCAKLCELESVTLPTRDQTRGALHVAQRIRDTTEVPR